MNTVKSSEAMGPVNIDTDDRPRGFYVKRISISLQTVFAANANLTEGEFP
jgi:hypothetical protein